jgi:amino acid transporter
VSFFLSVYLFVALYVGNITTLATASREIFAFARDRGLPFSSWLSKIDSRWHIPLNAVFAASAITALLSLIPLGSTLAFNIIASIALLSLLSTYMLSIGCVLWRRLSPKPLPPARWSLGRWGVPVNIFALAYSIFVIVFCCMPTTLPVTTDNANWTPALWVGFVAFAIGYYIFWGRKHYTAPVNFVLGHRAPEQAVQTIT